MYVTKPHLLSALIKEDKRSILCVSKAPLLNEGIKYLRVEEEMEERPLTGVAVLEKVFLVKQVRCLVGTLRWSTQQRGQGFPGRGGIRRQGRREVTICISFMLPRLQVPVMTNDGGEEP